MQRKLGRVVAEEGEEEQGGEKVEEEGEPETVAAEESSKLTNEPSRTSDNLTPNSLPETAPKSNRAPKHTKVSRAASHKSQVSVDYNTPPEEIRVGSFRRVRSGTRPVVGSKVNSLSRQGSGGGAKRVSEPNLRVGGSLDLQRRKSNLSVHRSVSAGYETDDEGNMYYSTSRPEWGFDQIAMHSDDDSDLEFFDAKGAVVLTLL